MRPASTQKAVTPKSHGCVLGVINKFVKLDWILAVVGVGIIFMLIPMLTRQLFGILQGVCFKLLFK